jgi:hypothetical protein
MSRIMQRRKDDSGENFQAWRAEARSARLRTIVLAMVASGILSLFIGYEIETSSYNDNARRAQQNCKLTQKVGERLTDIAEDVALNSQDPAIKERWAGYATDFGSTVPPTAETCERVFPTRSAIPFVE